MRDQKYQTRLSALTLWADMVSSRGYVPPAAEDLSAIAEHKKTDTPGLDQSLVGPWRDALKELLKQLAFNIADPHLQLSPEFDEPGPGAIRVAEPTPSPPTPRSRAGPSAQPGRVPGNGSSLPGPEDLAEQGHRGEAPVSQQPQGSPASIAGQFRADDGAGDPLRVPARRREICRGDGRCPDRAPHLRRGSRYGN